MPSSDNYPCSSLTLLAGGSRNLPPTKSMTRPTSSEFLSGTLREPMSALASHGTSANASKSLGSLYTTTLDASPSSTLSSHTSPTTMSYWHSYQALPARTWCGS